jgi:hypothetical protein
MADDHMVALSFAGRWGVSDVTTVGLFGEKEVARGRGPTSPALKDLWRRPVAAIFCNRHWRPRFDCGES